MQKTVTCLKLDANGKKFSVVFHREDEKHPFWLYRHTWSKSPNGDWYVERKRIDIKLKDMKSCLYYLSREY